MLSYFINRASLFLSVESRIRIFNGGTVGISLHIKSDPRVWRIPFGFQLVPAGIMFVGLFFVKV
jgi:hypothetical protein